MLVREGDRIIHKGYNKDVIVDCIEPSVMLVRMKRCYSAGFAQYMAYKGGMSTIADVIEVASIAGQKKPLIVKSPNDVDFACNGKIYAKKGS